MPTQTTTTGSSWRIEGAGYYYDFPDNFELVSFDRENEIPTRKVPGSDGITVDPRAVRSEKSRYVLAGKLQGSTVAGTASELDLLQAAVSQIHSDPCYLVDKLKNRRLAVRLLAVRIPIEPARTLDVSLTLETTISFWEALTPSFVTKINGRLFDLPVGDAPGDLKMTVLSSLSGASLVYGNWAFQWNGAYNRATAINSVSGKAPWGTVVDRGAGGQTIISTVFGFGRHIINNEMAFQTLYLRPDKLTFLVRFTALSTWPQANLPRWLFSVTDHGQTSALRLRITGNGGTLTLDTSTKTIAATPMKAFVKNQAYTISGWLDSAGTVIGATTYYAQLAVDGVTWKLSTTTFALSVASLGRVKIGSNHTGGGTCNEGMAALYIWNNNLGSGFIKGEANALRKLTGDNKVFKWSGALITKQQLHVDHELGQVYTRKGTAGSLAPSLASFSGDFFRMAQSNAHAKTNIDTVYSSKALTMHFTYTKRFF